MKKMMFAVLIALSAFSAFAQTWSLGGELYADYYKWDNGRTSDDSSEFYFGVFVGRYISDKMSAGIYSGFDFLDSGNVISFGPFFQYDFLKYELFSFGFHGSIFYSIYNSSYRWNDSYDAVDANRISVNGSLLFNFTPNSNVELFLRMFSIQYRHYWLTLPGNTACTVNNIIIASPVNSMSLGIKFKL
jgi:hypothetical protein